MPESYIILKFGNRRIVLRGESGNGQDATYTQHIEGYVTIDFHHCAFVGSVIVDGVDSEPTLNALLQRINEQYAPEISAEVNTCPTHGPIDKEHRCADFDGVLRDAWTGKILPDNPYGPTDNVQAEILRKAGMRRFPVNDPITPPSNIRRMAKINSDIQE